tara:strand:- start:12158 stop:12652 length:495 start_codon:yes stop_codon:yes gene_type:complete
MFDLVGEIEKSKKQISFEKVATTVQMATTLATQGVSSGDTLATTGDINNKIPFSSLLVANCRLMSPMQKSSVSIEQQGLSPKAPLSPPAELNLFFLNETPFTKAMIMKGLKLWGQPFSEDDLKAISAGELTVEEARRYLFLWARKNRDDFLVLKNNLTPSRPAY